MSVRRDSVEQFEREFAQTVNARFALAFPYARSALHAILQSRGLQGAEVLVPAYTCVVVPNSIVRSGNIPRFVDVDLHDYNMDLDELQQKVNRNTKAVLATHLYGYPLNTDRLNESLHGAGDDPLVIHDMALALGATDSDGLSAWKGGTAAIFSFSIGKHISTLEGGVAVTDCEDLYTGLKAYRDRLFTAPGQVKVLKRFVFLTACLASFYKRSYAWVLALAEKTPLLDGLTRYYDDDEITLPEDFQQNFTGLQGRIGLAQLKKLPEILRRRRELVQRYAAALSHLENIDLPPLAAGASYSHYVARVPDRSSFLATMKQRGINVGKELFDYSVPHLKAYQPYRDGTFERSKICARDVVNLPLYPSLSLSDQDHIVRCVERAVRC